MFNMSLVLVQQLNFVHFLQFALSSVCLLPSEVLPKFRFVSYPENRDIFYWLPLKTPVCYAKMPIPSR